MNLKSSKDIGELVRKTRKSHKITQKELAAASGTGIRFVQELEKGKPSCELEKALTVLLMLGIRVNAQLPETLKG